MAQSTLVNYTHRYDVDSGRLIQVVSPAELRAVLDTDGSSYSRPTDFIAADEWDVGDSTS